MKKTLKVLILGDVFGKPGRKAAAHGLPKLKKKYKPDLIVANAENLSHGNGVTKKTIDELRAAGVDAFTSGNHIFDKTEAGPLLEDRANRLIRPLNFAAGVPGAGAMEIDVEGRRILVLNLIGRVFMDAGYGNPFTAARDYLRSVHPADYAAILVDMHADASSEKVAMGYHLNGIASAVWGTHTHVPTADAKILDQGTAVITDVGMTGAADSVIGMDAEGVLGEFLEIKGKRPDAAITDSVQLNAWYLEINPVTRRCVAQKPINERYTLSE